MTAGYSPQLPLRHSVPDGYYALNKTFKDLVKQNIKMLFLTAPGERMMDPNFGIGLRNFLFENVNSDVRMRLSEKITSQISIYMPYIEVEQIEMIDLNQDNIITPENLATLGIRFSYFIKTMGIRDTLELTKLRG